LYSHSALSRNLQQLCALLA